MKTSNMLVVLVALALGGSGPRPAAASENGQAVTAPGSVEPPTLAPSELPPAPPPQPPPPPIGTAAEAPVEAPAATFPESTQGAGQWVHTRQYDWVFMPYGNQYVHEGTTEDLHPYAFVFRPGHGWQWVVAPWVWGWGPYPYFGPRGALQFGWYVGLFRSGWGWGRYRGGEPVRVELPARPDRPHGGRPIGGVRPDLPRPAPVVSGQHRPSPGETATARPRPTPPSGSFAAGIGASTAARPHAVGFGPAVGTAAAPGMGSGRTVGAAPAPTGGAMERRSGHR